MLSRIWFLRVTQLADMFKYIFRDFFFSKAYDATQVITACDASSKRETFHFINQLLTFTDSSPSIAPEIGICD